MKVISVHVDAGQYAALKVIAARRRTPVAVVIREALASATRAAEAGHSIFDLSPFDGGRQLARWTRSELLDEMLAR